MFGVGTGEVILILVIAMLVVGPERMVDFSRTAGTMLAKFRRETDSVTSEFKDALDLKPLQDAVTSAKEAVTEVGDTLKSTQKIAEGEVSAAKETVRDATKGIPTTSIAPSASAFADSQVSRAPSRPASPASVSDAATTLAMPGDSDEEVSEEVASFEVTELDGPEIMDDSSDASAATLAPVKSEG